MSVATTEALDSQVAGRFAGRLARRAQASDLPLAAQVVSWMDLVELCRELDESLVGEGAPSPKALALHAAVLELAIASGNSLIQQIQMHRADIAASGQTFETVTASLELMRIFHRSWHPDFTATEVDATRQRIFHAAA
jgi:hypothetical protein